MYHYVTDKVFIKESYRICADLVNQLVQELKHYDIQARMTCVGSKKRGLITQNGREPIDYDFNLWILDDGGYSHGSDLKNCIKEAFDYVLSENGLDECHCKDSKSVITTDLMKLKHGNKTPFSIDLCIVKEDKNGRWHRLIHEKTGVIKMDRWIWNIGPDGKDICQKEQTLKREHWEEVRKIYLDKKNMYLSRNDTTHPSFTCYIEVINEVYYKNQGSINGNIFGVHSINGISDNGFIREK